METYKFSEFPKRVSAASSTLKTQTNYTNRKYLQVKNLPLGDTLLIKENFDDFGETILFFLSVK